MITYYYYYYYRSPALVDPQLGLAPVTLDEGPAPGLQLAPLTVRRVGPRVTIVQYKSRGGGHRYLHKAAFVTRMLITPEEGVDLAEQRGPRQREQARARLRVSQVAKGQPLERDRAEAACGELLYVCG
jgi:hypothetical protein